MSPKGSTQTPPVGRSGPFTWRSKVSVFALHLRDARAQADWPAAERQFQTLARQADTEAPNYWAADADNAGEIAEGAAAIRLSIARNLADAAAGSLASLRDTAAGESETFQAEIAELSPDAQGIATGLQNALADQLVTYLGRSAEPPRDFTAWVFDRDLTDPTRAALDVRVLLTRTEVADLADALQDIVDGYQNNQEFGMTFYEALQNLSAGAASGRGGDFTSQESLTEAGVLPGWIDGLPYRSVFAGMSPDEFEELSAMQRESLIVGVRSKLANLQAHLDNEDNWHRLDERVVDPKQFVTPLPLEALP